MYFSVHLGLLAACGLAGPGSADVRLRLRAGEGIFLNILPTSFCFFEFVQSLKDF